MTERKRTVSPIAKPAPLSKRLPDMSDRQLVTYQSTANRISGDPEHPKHAQALHAAPLIDAEIRKRAAGLEAAKAAEPAA